jgi:hypothetical protein
VPIFFLITCSEQKCLPKRQLTNNAIRWLITLSNKTHLSPQQNSIFNQA